MRNAIVITSIFPPTPAVRQWAALSDWRVVVVGDRKTPENWRCEPVTFVSARAQEAAPFRIAGRLPWNHYARKMLGYLMAAQQGAQVIVDTDDDNIPKPDWAFPDFEGSFRVLPQGLGFINIYTCFTRQHIWPRGFPLQRISDASAHAENHRVRTAPVRVGIWQGLADVDPDVDAIYRMTVGAPCCFDNKAPVVLDTGTLCPFNSQNTAFVREVFPLLYLPASVSFRSTDIIRGLVAQPVLWNAGYRLGFTGATVVQHRNEHDYLADFASEIPCYLYPEKIADAVRQAVRSSDSLEDNFYSAYESLVRSDIIPAKELELLSDWILDIQDVMKVS